MSDPRGPMYEKGLSDYNQTHAFKNSFIWDIPAGSLEANPVSKAVFGGWELTGNIQYYTGMPLTARNGLNQFVINSPYFGAGRADMIPGVPINAGTGDRLAQIRQWFNPAAFTYHPIDGQQGTAARGTFNGPGAIYNDLAVMKNISLYKEGQVKLQFRAEFFNAINWVNLGGPDTGFSPGSIAAGNIGRIYGAGDPRIMQFGLKLLF